MKRLLIAACLALASCSPTLNSAGSVATTVDNTGKKAVTSANRLYTTASKAGAELVRQGFWSKEAYKAADQKAYSMLLEVQTGRAALSQLVPLTIALSGGRK